jgi:hypothetical protein
MTFDTMKISKKEPIDLVDDEFLDSLPDSLMVRLFLDFALTD